MTNQAVKRTYCTYFDRNYLLKGLALYESLCTHVIHFNLYVLCFDVETYRILSKLDLPGISLIALEQFEHNDSDLIAVKGNRTVVEYYWTCTPSLPLYLLRLDSTLTEVIYLDADMFLFHSPEPLFEEFADNSILIVEHRYSAEASPRTESSGRFNVGFLVFRRDTYAMQCLQWWRARCIEWCYHREEDGKLGDQMYLNQWPERFQGVHILQHAGGAAAPWNIRHLRLSRKGSIILVDGEPLILYHFHQFELVNRHTFQATHGYKLQTNRIVSIYLPYMRSLRRAWKKVNASKPYTLPLTSLQGQSLLSAILDMDLYSVYDPRLWGRSTLEM